MIDVMKIKDLTDDLEGTKCFKDFKKEYPHSFLYAIFLILSKEKESDKIQIDYFLPGLDKIASFEWPFKEVKIHEDEIKNCVKQDINNLKVDLDNLDDVIDKAIKDNNSKINVKKIIGILKGDEFNITCLDNAMGIVRMNFNALTGECLKFDKSSLGNFMKVKKV